MSTHDDISEQTTDAHCAVDQGRRDLLKAGAITGVALPVMMLAPSVFAQSEGDVVNTGGKTTTLIIASHPYPDRTVFNKALWEVARQADRVEFKNLEMTYGDKVRGLDFGIDVDAERKAYEGKDLVVFIFPIHWFNLTPLLKAYMNEVWTQWAPTALKGKRMLVVVTAGAGEGSYLHQGNVGLTISEVLAPMRASANYAGMTYLEPLAFLGVSNADGTAVRRYQDQLARRLQEEIGTTR